MATAAIRHASHEVKRQHKLEIMARVGYAAHGLVYALVAVFAIDAAFGGGGEEAKGGKGAVSAIAGSDWGTALIAVLAVGLVAYGLMRLWQGLADPSGHGTDAKGLGVRAGRIGSGLMQLGLAFYAGSLAFGWFGAGVGGGGGGGSGGGGSGAEGLTAQVMSWPAGRWIIGAVGVGIAIGGLMQLKKAIKADFMDELAVDRDKAKWVKPTGRAGFASRFVVFGIIGGFLIAAAVNANPDRAEGLGGALRTLQDQAYGPWLLGITALGLLAFAITRGVFARYKMIPAHDAG
jgi:hypothetical protein